MQLGVFDVSHMGEFMLEGPKALGPDSAGYYQ